MNLTERWMSLPWNGRDHSLLVKKLGVVLESYDRPERAYHNLTHLKECLLEFDRVKKCLDLANSNPFAIELALWYHDLVYDTNARFVGWNEAASAGVAFDHLTELGFAGDFICKVQFLILATRHDKFQSDRGAQFIADIDLSILGKNRERVDEYERGIRIEYATYKNIEAFKKGRREILRRLLNRGGIYQSEYFRNLYEKAAIANLKRLIADLS